MVVKLLGALAIVIGASLAVAALLGFVVTAHERPDQTPAALIAALHGETR